MDEEPANPKKKGNWGTVIAILMLVGMFGYVAYSKGIDPKATSTGVTMGIIALILALFRKSKTTKAPPPNDDTDPG
jgi:hypothetical protein